MMEPVTLGTISLWIATGAVEKIGEDLWNKLIAIILEQLKKHGTEVLLNRAKKNPTDHNIQILEGELVTQMNEDKDFEKKVISLVPALQPKDKGAGSTYTWKGANFSGATITAVDGSQISQFGNTTHS
ncbi:MAG: hypothetical protein U7123_12215 [Potamolinea sp.]